MCKSLSVIESLEKRQLLAAVLEFISEGSCDELQAITSDEAAKNETIFINWNTIENKLLHWSICMTGSSIATTIYKTPLPFFVQFSNVLFCAASPFTDGTIMPVTLESLSLGFSYEVIPLLFSGAIEKLY